MSEALVTKNQAVEIAAEAVELALERRKKTQKRGRADQGTGSKMIGAIVKAWREHYSMDITEVAKIANLHPTTVGKIESGQRGMSLKTLACLVNALGYDFAKDVLWQMGNCR